MIDYAPLLIKLGITPNYTSFSQLACALDLVRQDPDSLQLVTKCLYPAVARRFGTNWKAVERNLRAAASIAWRRNPGLVSRLAGYPLSARPTSAQFMAILSHADPSFLP